jgi:hypothetical protein
MEGGAMTFNAQYSLETGAAKKRKKEKEVAYWNSLNGPVVVNSIKGDDDGE